MNKNRSLLVGLILVSGFFMPISASAQNFIYTPYIIFSGEYNDNILFLRNDKIDDFLVNIDPALKIDYKTDLLQLHSFASVIFKRYFTETDYDREDYYFDISGKYKVTERLLVNGKFNFIKDFSLESRPLDFGDPTIDPGTEFIGDQGIENFYSERRRYKALARLAYQLTEVSDVYFKYRYLKNDYDFTGNADYERNMFEFIYLHSLKNQKDRLGPRFSYTQNTSDESDYDSYNAALVWEHVFTETLSLSTDVGMRYTDETFNNSNRGDNSVWGATADIWLTKRGETNVMDFGFKHDVGTASSGRPVNVSRFYYRLKQLLDDRLFFELKGDFYVTNEDNYSSFDNATYYFDIIPSLKYMLTENHSVNLAYSYTIDYDNALDDNPDKQRNRVWVVFEFGFPKAL